MRSLVEFKERVLNTAGSTAINNFSRINAETSECYVDKVKKHKNSNTKMGTNALQQALIAYR